MLKRLRIELQANDYKYRVKDLLWHKPAIIIKSNKTGYLTTTKNTNKQTQAKQKSVLLNLYIISNKTNFI